MALAFLPYYLWGNKSNPPTPPSPLEGEDKGGGAKGLRLLWHKLKRSGTTKKVVNAVVVILIFTIFVSFIYLGTYKSPTLGCNGCHSLARGQRMGVPPETFKDRSTLPNLNNNLWMMGHWFYPTVVW